MRAFVVSELNLNRIVWDTESSDFTDYEILKDDQSFITIDTQTTREYADTDVNCGRVYCYSVVMHEGNGLISRSATVCVTAISAGIDEPIIDISASVDGSDVKLSWPPSVTFPVNAYIPQRLNESGSFLPLDTLSDTSFTDSDLSVTGNRYFYQVYVTDECGNISDTSAVAGTILLQLGADGLLTWSTYKGWNNGVNSYVLNKLDLTGQLILSIPMGQDTSFVDNPDDSNLQGVIYRVQAVPVDSQLDPVFSNFIQIIYRSEVHFPNAFTPNGDGLNDTFTFKGRFIQSGTIKIFSRWGELIYVTSELDQGWDGTINGQQAPVGTYIYSAQLTDDSGIQFEKRGQIVLIR
jgi:gliding motility-associated-like protein